MEPLYAIFAVSAVGGICLQLISKRSKMTSYIQFLLSLVLLLMLLSPLVNLLLDLHLPNPEDVLASYQGVPDSTFYEDTVISGAIMRASASLAALISAETGIPSEDMEVSLTTESRNGETETEITVTAVTVRLYRRAHHIAADKVRAAAERVLFCPCTVLLEVQEDA